MLTTNDPQSSDGMNQTGVMVADTVKNTGGKIDSFAKSGVIVTDTQRIQYDSRGTETLNKQARRTTHRLNVSGKLAINQWVKMDGKWYWFGENGYMVQGAWVDGDKYYVNDEGVYIPNYREDPTADDKE